MAYAALTALLDAEDPRSHNEWLLAVLYERHRELWLNPPAGLKADIVALMDLAAERAVKQVLGLKFGGPVSDADVQRGIELARKLRPQIEAEFPEFAVKKVEAGDRPCPQIESQEAGSERQRREEGKSELR